MKQKRLTGYIDADQHAALEDALRKDGMTLTGFLRKMVRIYLIEQQRKADKENETN